jgi:hypothetical protein
MKNKTRIIVRIFGSVSAFIVSIFYLNGAVFCFWAASGPPCDKPEYYIKFGYIYLLATAILIIISGLILWYFRPSNKKFLAP